MKRQLSVVGVAYFLGIGTMLLLAIRASVEPTVVSEIVRQRGSVDDASGICLSSHEDSSLTSEPRQLVPGSHDNPYGGISISVSDLSLFAIPATDNVLILQTNSSSGHGDSNHALISTNLTEINVEQFLDSQAISDGATIVGLAGPDSATTFDLIAAPSSLENVFPREHGNVCVSVGSNVNLTSAIHFNTQDAANTFSIQSYGQSSPVVDIPRFESVHIPGSAIGCVIDGQIVLAPEDATFNSAFKAFRGNFYSLDWNVGSGQSQTFGTSTAANLSGETTFAAGNRPAIYATNTAVNFIGGSQISIDPWHLHAWFGLPLADSGSNSVNNWNLQINNWNLQEFDLAGFYGFWQRQTEKADPKKTDAAVSEPGSEE